MSQSPDKLPALGQQRSIAGNQPYDPQLDSADSEDYDKDDGLAYNQRSRVAKSNRTLDNDGRSAMLDGQTGLQIGDGIEPEEDDANSDGGLSVAPVPKANDIQLPEIDMENLALEDIIDGKPVKWKSRRDCGTYDDTTSKDGDKEKEEEAEEEEQEKAEGQKSSAIDVLNKKKMELQAANEQIKNLLEVEAQKKALGAKSDQDIKPNLRFKYFNDAFSGLTRSKNVKTKYPIIDCIMTYNSKSAITITKKNDREYIINQYDLENYAMTFEEILGGQDDSYIKVSQVEQNSSGTNFAVAYLDDGKFKLRIFGALKRTERQIFDSELDINAEFELDNHTMPIDNFPDPFISCVFVTDTIIFVNFFHNKIKKHFHFFYDSDTKEYKQKTEIKIESNNKNFPVKAFYNTEYNEVYTFYRQGQSFRVPVFVIPCDQNYEAANIQTTRKERKPDYTFEDIYDKDLGQMFLINETALVCRSSSLILFFKLEIDEFTGQKRWQNYHTLEFGGNIFHIKGTWRVQIVTDNQVYFYEIDEDTFVPQVRNVMNNFMNCSMMMFGSKGKYGITYKTNEGNFDVYRAKYVHDYKVTVVHEDFDGSMGLPVESMKAFLVGVKDTIKFYDVNDFAEIKESEIKIPLFQSVTREPNEIISMQISPKEDILAVISGKKLIMDENKPNQIFIFKRKKNLNASDDQMDQFEFIKKIKIMDNPAFEKISMQFKFQNVKYDRDVSHLLFARQDRIVRLDIWDETTTELAFFNMPLTRQPDYFLMSDKQDIAIIASIEDGIYFNLENKAWIDLDETYDISLIKEIIHDSKAHFFYLLANKYQGKSGVFLIKFHEDNPKQFNFFVKYKTKLDIADANIAIVRNTKEQFKELIVSYKTINENTYNVFIVDISGKQPYPLYRHESFQLWESKISAFFLKDNNDYIMLNGDGISLISLGTNQKRLIKSSNGQENMIHAIQSVDYLKCNKTNFMFFDFSGTKKEINIEQQFMKETKAGQETAYEKIFRLQIHKITLRELLFFQSLYVCSTQSEILKLVSRQPRPAVFYKSFLELDGTNMTSILAFDSRCMNYLLKEDNAEFFNEDYPLFYKNKMVKLDNRDKYFYRSAIDMAIQANQLSAVSAILDYMVLHQNNYTSSYMFRSCFIELIEKDVPLSGVLDSNVFRYQFDFDEWTSTHKDPQTYIRPYNFSLFDLRDHYETCFPDLMEEAMRLKEQQRCFNNNEENQKQQSNKIFKIKYELNVLPQMFEHVIRDKVTGEEHFENEGQFLMEKFAECQELEVFRTKGLTDNVDFKWVEFGKQFHMIGCIGHFSYMTLLFVYIGQIYVMNNIQNSTVFQIGLCAGLAYPAIYEFYQMKRLGFTEYVSEPVQSISDQLYIWCGIANVFQVLVLGFDAQGFQCKILMTVILTQQIMKSFFFLRIFESLSYIVTMIFTVVADLQAFLLFFTLLILVFGFIFAVIGAGNPNQPGGFRDTFGPCLIDDWENITDEQLDFCDDDDTEIPGEEYQLIGLFLGYLFSTLRIAMGDFDFGATIYLKTNENILYWIMWVVVVVLTCIIFLNFIIAEASASYQKVVDDLEPLIYQSKAHLIKEAEQILPDKVKGENWFPRFIVIRSVDM